MFKKHQSPLTWTSLVLVIIGGLNWGLIAVFNFNAVDFLLKGGSPLARIVYALVGLSALYLIFALAKMKK